MGDMSGEDCARIRLSVAGRVQGVGFRHFIWRRAGELKLRGWVRNEANGSVLIEAQGSQDALDRLEALARRGPSMARVDSIRREEIALAEGEEDFSIAP
jgi:acylphosphatase